MAHTIYAIALSGPQDDPPNHPEYLSAVMELPPVDNARLLLCVELTAPFKFEENEALVQDLRAKLQALGMVLELTQRGV